MGIGMGIFGGKGGVGYETKNTCAGWGFEKCVIGHKIFRIQFTLRFLSLSLSSHSQGGGGRGSGSSVHLLQRAQVNVGRRQRASLAAVDRSRARKAAGVLAADAGSHEAAVEAGGQEGTAHRVERPEHDRLPGGVDAAAAETVLKGAFLPQVQRNPGRRHRPLRHALTRPSRRGGASGCRQEVLRVRLRAVRHEGVAAAQGEVRAVAVSRMHRCGTNGRRAVQRRRPRQEEGASRDTPRGEARRELRQLVLVRREAVHPAERGRVQVHHRLKGARAAAEPAEPPAAATAPSVAPARGAAGGEAAARPQAGAVVAVAERVRRRREAGRGDAAAAAAAAA
eukprot:Rhum_TRINITY_DN9390_c0_g1::Rhum_TRINITY_DN9390_c0_g1_i1::g.33235::m.33235